MIESRRQTGQWRRIAPPPGSTQSTSRLFCAAESEINRIVTLGAVPGRTLPRSKPERSPRLLNEVSTGIEYRLPPGSCRVRRWPVNYRKLTNEKGRVGENASPFLAFRAGLSALRPRRHSNHEDRPPHRACGHADTPHAHGPTAVGWRGSPDRPGDHARGTRQTG